MDSCFDSRNRDLAFPTHPLGTLTRTGARCPEQGIWQVDGLPGHNIHILKGRKMPSYAGTSVPWRFIEPT